MLDVALRLSCLGLVLVPFPFVTMPSLAIAAWGSFMEEIGRNLPTPMTVAALPTALQKVVTNGVR